MKTTTKNNVKNNNKPKQGRTIELTHSPVRMEEVFAGTQRQDGHGALVAVLRRPHLGVVEQVVALLPREAHVDAKAVGRASPAVPQKLLGDLHGLGGQQRAAEEVTSWKSDQNEELEGK